MNVIIQSNIIKHKGLLLCFIISIGVQMISQCQTFYFGADQSYVNEMEDCGAQYKEDGVSKELFQIFADHGCNLTRLRLWHTPAWYDQLNDGERYSNLPDVMKSIRRSHEAGIEVLLNFHLSDNWADPSKQLVPEAWLSVVDNTELLGDSLYQYLYNTLNKLNERELLPKMLQIGNETNRGILLSPEDNQTWTLDWERNAYLFNRGISAVHDFNEQAQEDVQIMVHVAGPKDIEWFINEFQKHGVTDYDVIGMSYYWAWHQPAEIKDAKAVISNLRATYPDKKVIVVETGYPWTSESNDNAANIINELHPDYSPATPENQKKWLIDLTTAVMDAGGHGVVYWEPSWVSTPCWNQWNQGSHQEHATFFDFNNNLLKPGGIEWMEHEYSHTAVPEYLWTENLSIEYQADSQVVHIEIPERAIGKVQMIIANNLGQIEVQKILNQPILDYKLEKEISGLIVISLQHNHAQVMTKKVIIP